MMGVIKYQKKENMAFEILPNGVKRAEMLPGMVEGVHTYKCQVKAGETVELEVFGDITCETANCQRSKLHDIIGVIHSLTALSVWERHFLGRGTARSRSFIPGKPTALLK